VPEERHFFLQWPRAGCHALQPPLLQLNHPLALVPLLLLLHLLPGFGIGVVRLFKALGALRVGFGPLRVGIAIGNFFVIDQIEDTRQRAEIGKALNLGGRAAKTGAIEQMRGGLEIPPLTVNRLQHT